jgi:PAT family beta-lactamase induction signal transducer AmpG
MAKAAAHQSFGQWFKTAVVGPFADFMKRPMWPLILLFAFDYKIGEGMGAIMSTPLYINSLHFTLDEIALVSKFVGFFGVIFGALLGGIVTVRYGILRSLMICGVLQVVGNLFYVLQAVGGHRLSYLAICVTAEQVTSAMAGAALIAYLSSLCSPEFTATQYALLSSLTFLGGKVFGALSGVLADAVGWVPFFLIATAASVPALLLLVWFMRREGRGAAEGSLSVAAAKN